MVKETEAAARAQRVTLRPVSARRPEELDRAFGEMSKVQTDGLVVLPDAMFLASRKRIAELARNSRLPAIDGIGEHTQAGRLMSYSLSLPDLFRRAARYGDRILKGAKPGELPVEQPSKFQLVTNLNTAKALGLTIPPSVLARADEVIQ
jgi:putative tryptophan/tyrosine transport system substrate-binding protein